MCCIAPRCRFTGILNGLLEGNLYEARDVKSADKLYAEYFLKNLIEETYGCLLAHTRNRRGQRT